MVRGVTNNSFVKGFCWSLRPITFPLKILTGLSLDSDRNHLCSFVISIVIATSILAFSLGTTGYMFYRAVRLYSSQLSDIREYYKGRNLTNFGNFESRNEAISAALSQLSALVLQIGLHLGFFVASLTTWKRVSASLLQVERQFNLRPEFYKKCYWISWICLIYYLLVNLNKHSIDKFRIKVLVHFTKL